VLAARSSLIQRDIQCMSGGTRGRTDTNLAKTVLRFGVRQQTVCCPFSQEDLWPVGPRGRGSATKKTSVMNKIQASAAALGVRLDVLEPSTDSEIEAAFAKVAQHSGAPIMLGPDAAGARKSFLSRHAMPYPSCMSPASSPKPADSDRPMPPCGNRKQATVDVAFFHRPRRFASVPVDNLWITSP
jgi:hypothetical protein